MDYFVVCLVAVVAAGLTFFSGFGLGTLLMPLFLFFFPPPVAIAATAIVHLTNNLFKAALIGRTANWDVVLRFGLPAAFAAVAGAKVLELVGKAAPLASYQLNAHSYEITPLRLTVGILVILFSLVELAPRFGRFMFPRKYLMLGGAASGFFGGLAGYQGAVRTAFLVKSGLEKEEFVGTGVMCALIVDSVRLPIYGIALLGVGSTAPPGLKKLVVAATLAAFAGSFVASQLLHKVTWHALRWIVGVGLMVLGLAVSAGIV